MSNHGSERASQTMKSDPLSRRTWFSVKKASSTGAFVLKSLGKATRYTRGQWRHSTHQKTRHIIALVGLRVTRGVGRPHGHPCSAVIGTSFVVHVGACVEYRQLPGHVRICPYSLRTGSSRRRRSLSLCCYVCLCAVVHRCVAAE